MAKHSWKTDKDLLLQDIEEKLQSNESKKCRTRFIAVKMALLGYTNAEIAAILSVGVTSVRDWCRKVNNEGVSALFDKPKPGRPFALNEEELVILKDAIFKGPEAYGYDIWTGISVSEFIQTQFGKALAPCTCVDYLHRINFSFTRPTVRPNKNPDSEIRNAFKKKCTK